MRRLLYIGTILLSTACKQNEVPTEVIIEGHVKNLPDGMLYLVEAHNWQTSLDSTVVRDGQFAFRLKADSSFSPFLASLQFSDSTSPTKVQTLVFRNFTMGADSNKYGYAAFFLEPGLTRIEGDLLAEEKLRVFAGKETELLYNKALSEFGWLGNLDSAHRHRRIEFYKSQIRRHSFSHYLLSGIYNAKEQYSKQELSDILAVFDNHVQASKAAKDIRTYLALRPDPDEPVANLFLVNAKGERRNIIDNSARLNMLVFWASWCGPCRREIPALKQIFSQYAGRGMKMVSISIDENKEQWQAALEKERMNWAQFIVDSNQIQKVKQQYNFAAIPLVVFTDGQGNEIKRFVGNAPGEEKLYHEVIKSTLNIK
jgi:thiol-disulfide isomerase/thioredoxin